jgi:hypothetical protein
LRAIRTTEPLDRVQSRAVVAGPLDFERVSAVASASPERRLTQVLEAARSLGLGRLGRVAIMRRACRRTRHPIAAKRGSSCGTDEPAFGSVAAFAWDARPDSVSDHHRIVAQRVHQANNGNAPPVHTRTCAGVGLYLADGCLGYRGTLRQIQVLAGPEQVCQICEEHSAPNTGLDPHGVLFLSVRISMALFSPDVIIESPNCASV